MLCSNCGNVVRPVVAVDIDGTLGDYHGHFLAFAEQYLGHGRRKGAPRYMGEPSFHEWFVDAYGSDDKTWHDIKLAYRQGGMKRSMPIFSGAQSLINEIRLNDAELWVTTTRPYLSLDNIIPDTVEWLSRHGIEYEGMLFDEDKYAQLVQRVNPERIVAVIDDLLEMCDAADEAVGSTVAIMAANPFNQAFAGSGRRHALVDIYHWIGPEIQEWRVRHA